MDEVNRENERIECLVPEVDLFSCLRLDDFSHVEFTPHVITPGGMGIIRRTEATRYRAGDSYVSVFSGSKSKVGSSGSKAVTSVQRFSRKVGHCKLTEEDRVREGASFSGSFDGGSGPGVNQANPIQEYSTNRVVEMDPLEEVSGATVSVGVDKEKARRVVEESSEKLVVDRSKIGSPVGVMKAKVVSRGKGKAPEVVQKVGEEGKDEEDDVFVPQWKVRRGDTLKKPSTCCEILRHVAPPAERAHNSALKEEKLMSNVIFHAVRLASSLPNVIDRWKAMQVEYSEAVTTEVIAGTEIKSLTSERDDLRSIAQAAGESAGPSQSAKKVKILTKTDAAESQPDAEGATEPADVHALTQMCTSFMTMLATLPLMDVLPLCQVALLTFPDSISCYTLVVHTLLMYACMIAYLLDYYVFGSFVSLVNSSYFEVLIPKRESHFDS
ncbi:hypothetical protein QVD17_38098 [Tagetes erecta]|uniref:Uncharacterized protein n=1 Tax=Tagetes erecta TaxID=13708 RepID=A0AAD8JXB1_TARER|nr:hypothetical protein QVD17_38098 [Tagetes erecta]